MNEKGGKRPKGQMTGGANDLGAKDLGAKDRGGKSPTPHPLIPTRAATILNVSVDGHSASGTDQTD